MVSRTTDVVGSVGVEAHLGDVVHIEAPIVTPSPLSPWIAGPRWGCSRAERRPEGPPSSPLPLSPPCLPLVPAADPRGGRKHTSYISTSRFRRCSLLPSVRHGSTGVPISSRSSSHKSRPPHARCSFPRAPLSQVVHQPTLCASTRKND
jgi:hypothetical protein